MLILRRVFFESILQFIYYSIIKLIFDKKYIYSKYKRIKIEINDLTFNFNFFNIDRLNYVQFAIFLHFY